MMNERNDGMTMDDQAPALGGFGAAEQVLKVQYVCGRKYSNLLLTFLQNVVSKMSWWSEQNSTSRRSSARVAPAEFSTKSDRESHSSTKHAEKFGYLGLIRISFLQIS